MTNSVTCRVEVGLLGPFTLRVGGRQVRSDVWKSKKALTLLKYLASIHGRRVSSDALIELLWPDQINVDIQRNLHTAIWFARRILLPEESPTAESPLRYSHGSYWLDLGGTCIDVALFESHATRSRELEATNREMALFHCEAALALYRDDFLCEDIYEEWTIPHRDEYRELYFQVIVRAAELLITHRGDSQEALNLCRAALKKDPFREELYAAALKALIAGRRFMGALNLYKQYVKMLKDEFGLEPSPAVTDLINNMKESVQRANASPKPVGGAYVCSRAVLQSFLETESRRLKLTGNHYSVLVVGNNGASEEQFLTAFTLLQSLLRDSDVICHYAPTMIVVLMPYTTGLGAKILSSKAQQALEQRFGRAAPFSFLILSSEQLDVLQNRWSALAAT